jgi:CBS domain-containing protein
MPQALKDVMTTDLVSCPADTSLTEVARLMRDRDIGDVLVTDGDRLRGIVTDRDIVVRCLAAADGDIERMNVADACSPDTITGRPDMTIDEAVGLMRTSAIRRLPVVEDGRPVGIVSLGDLALERDSGSALADISAAEPNS